MKATVVGWRAARVVSRNRVVANQLPIRVKCEGTPRQASGNLVLNSWTPATGEGSGSAQQNKILLFILVDVTDRGGICLASVWNELGLAPKRRPFNAV